MGVTIITINKYHLIMIKIVHFNFIIIIMVVIIFIEVINYCRLILSNLLDCYYLPNNQWV